jgi:hypothetical protein
MTRKCVIGNTWLIETETPYIIFVDSPQSGVLAVRCMKNLAT